MQRSKVTWGDWYGVIWHQSLALINSNLPGSNISQEVQLKEMRKAKAEEKYPGNTEKVKSVRWIIVTTKIEGEIHRGRRQSSWQVILSRLLRKIIFFKFTGNSYFFLCAGCMTVIHVIVPTIDDLWISIKTIMPSAKQRLILRSSGQHCNLMIMVLNGLQASYWCSNNWMSLALTWNKTGNCFYWEPKYSQQLTQ